MRPAGPTVEETAVRLTANGVMLFEWRATPTDLEALVVGRLYIEGMIDDAVPGARLAIQTNDEGTIEITVPTQLRARASTRPRHSRNVPDADAFSVLFRNLFMTVDERHESGGMHAAGLGGSKGIAFQAEDVGRHNAVDKVVGMALLSGAEPADYGMLVSARVSGEIARKAAQAGVAWLASRSIPTTMAVRIAREAGMPLIGRAAGKNAFVY